MTVTYGFVDQNLSLWHPIKKRVKYDRVRFVLERALIRGIA